MEMSELTARLERLGKRRAAVHAVTLVPRPFTTSLDDRPDRWQSCVELLLSVRTQSGKSSTVSASTIPATPNRLHVLIVRR